MPISLRLPADIETRIAGFGARQGMSKSAVIVRSIQEFLTRHAQPTSFQIYQDVMRDGTKANARNQRGDARNQRSDAGREAAEKRPEKIAVRDAIRRKHAARSGRAGVGANEALAKTSAAPRSGTRKPA